MAPERVANPPLIVIVGQTASGKSDLAMTLAVKFGGEIIAADSRTIYRSMDIGTAKPTREDQALVPHHIIDIRNPDEYFSAAEFKKLASRAITEIYSKGKLPIIVGGSGLYIDSVLYDFSFSPPADPYLRLRLNALPIEELKAIINEQGIVMPNNHLNKRHLVRQIETGGVSSENSSLRSNTLVVGMPVTSEVISHRIVQRIDNMIASGFIDEARHLFEIYDSNAPGLQAPGYKAYGMYVNGDISLDDVRTHFIKGDTRLAKRQRTWFKRNKSIHWVEEQIKIVDLVTSFLNNNTSKL